MPAFFGIKLLEAAQTTLEYPHPLNSSYLTAVPSQDFFAKPCWSHHPKPYKDFIAHKKSEAAALEAERKRAIRV